MDEAPVAAPQPERRLRRLPDSAKMRILESRFKDDDPLHLGSDSK
jgi:hypothetical protein